MRLATFDTELSLGITSEETCDLAIISMKVLGLKIKKNDNVVDI